VHGWRVPRAQLAQHPRQRAKVVFVTVRDHDRLDVLGALAEVAEIRQHQVYAEHVRCRKTQPGVDDDDPVAVLDDGHVLADLTETAERQDPKRAVHRAVTSCSNPWRSSIARTVAVSCSSSSA